MGTLSLAAKITHVPSMYLSEQEGEHKGCRQPAIDGHHEIDRRCRELGVDTIVVFDTHWLVNGAITSTAHPTLRAFTPVMSYLTLSKICHSTILVIQSWAKSSQNLAMRWALRLLLIQIPPSLQNTARLSPCDT